MNIYYALKRLLKSLLQNIGLYQYIVRFEEFLDPEIRRRRKIKRFKTVINEVKVEFSTEDEYSNSWFLPRYEGGLIHEKPVTEMLLDALNGAKCFMDVGTNLGWYTCLACKHMPNGTVYGFEMDDLNFDLLKKNISINNCNNVEVFNVAVSDSPGEVSYWRETNSPSPVFSMKTSPSEKISGSSVSVSTIALDDFLADKGMVPDVVKIDVEGAEMEVLKGMMRTLKESKPILFLEIHPKNLVNFDTSTSEILSLLLENDYKVYEIEAIRTQESIKHLEPLQKDSVLEVNTMLYATTAEQ